MRRAAIIITTLSLALPAAAAAQAPPTTPPPPTAPSPPVQAGGRMSLTITRAYRDGRAVFALTRQRLLVRGTVSAFAPGQRVTVRIYRDGRRLRKRRIAIRARGKGGGFAVAFSSSRAGRVTVRADHAATPEQRRLAARRVSVRVVSMPLRAGARGPVVRFLQRRLAALHYAVPRSAAFDGGTARAVLAYRKVNGLARTTTVDRLVFRRLALGSGAFRLRYPKHGRHVEADLSRQVLVLADGARPVRVYPISSGKPSTPTVRGMFRFYSKQPGTNSHGMVHSTYFYGGYAVHGYAQVPPYAASHGCLRVPIPDAFAIYSWIRIGDRIDVYP